MRFRRLCLLAVAAALQALAQPSVDQILEKYAQALGGPAAYEKATTWTMRGTVEVPDDNVTGTAQLWAKAPGSYRLALEIPGYGVVETVLDGEHAWKRDPDSGIRAMSSGDLELTKRDHHFYREMKLKELFPTLRVAGTEKVNDRNVYLIEAAPASGPAEKLYFDSGSGLLVKREFERVTLEDGIVQYTVMYSDYREVDGVKVPSVIEQRSPDNTMILKFSEIKQNAPLEDKTFAKPEK